MDDMRLSGLGVVVWVVTGCASDTRYPIGPGGGGSGTGSGPHPDAAVDSAISGDGVIHGRVCLLANPQDPASCKTTGADGLAVHLGTGTATTSADGSFAIAMSSGDWSVTGASIVTSHKLFGGGDYVIPAIATTDFETMKTSTGVVIAQGEGSIIAWIVHNGAGLQNATVTSMPVATYAAYYDGAGAWLQVSTGVQGVAWIPGINAGTASLTVTPSGGSGTSVPGLPVIDREITFVEVKL